MPASLNAFQFEGKRELNNANSNKATVGADLVAKVKSATVLTKFGMVNN